MMDSFLLVMRALFAVFWAEVISRTTGPLVLRFLLEPLMASALAICGGLLAEYRGNKSGNPKNRDQAGHHPCR